MVIDLPPARAFSWLWSYVQVSDAVPAGTFSTGYICVDSVAYLPHTCSTSFGRSMAARSAVRNASSSVGDLPVLTWSHAFCRTGKVTIW